MLFFTVVAWIGVTYFTIGWTCTWALILLGHGEALKLKAGAIVGPVVCWGWLIAGWLS